MTRREQKGDGAAIAPTLRRTPSVATRGAPNERSRRAEVGREDFVGPRDGGGVVGRSGTALGRRSPEPVTVAANVCRLTDSVPFRSGEVRFISMRGGEALGI